jgi:hypothetical protein
MLSGLTALTCCAPCMLQVDGNDQKTPGWRFNYWELKGVPVRIEVGPRDVEQGVCVLARRDRPGEGGDCGAFPLRVWGSWGSDGVWWGGFVQGGGTEWVQKSDRVVLRWGQARNQGPRA